MQFGETPERAAKRDWFITHRAPYIRHDGPNPDQVYLSTVKSLIRPGMTVLDIGTGTGHVPAALGELHPGVRVLACDSSPAMVRIARRKAAGAANVHVIQAVVGLLPLRDATADLITAKLAPFDMMEVRRVLRPGGCFLTFGYVADDEGDEVERIFGPRTIHYDRRRRDWRAYLQGEGFVDIQVRRIGGVAHWTVEDIACVMEFAPVVADFDRARDADALRRMQEVYGDEDGIRIRYNAYIASGRLPG